MRSVSDPHRVVLPIVGELRGGSSTSSTCARREAMWSSRSSASGSGPESPEARTRWPFTGCVGGYGVNLVSLNQMCAHHVDVRPFGDVHGRNCGRIGDGGKGFPGSNSEYALLWHCGGARGRGGVGEHSISVRARPGHPTGRGVRRPERGWPPGSPFAARGSVLSGYPHAPALRGFPCKPQTWRSVGALLSGPYSGAYWSRSATNPRNQTRDARMALVSAGSHRRAHTRGQVVEPEQALEPLRSWLASSVTVRVWEGSAAD